MASVDQPFSNENDQNQNGGQPGQGAVQPQGQGGGNTSLSGGSAVGGGAGSAGGGGSTQNGGNNQQGANNAAAGSYPNLSKYMAANQNWNSSTGGLGGEIAGNLNQQSNQVQQSVQNANNAFQNQGNTWEQNTQNASNAFQQGIANPYAYQQSGPNAGQQANQALNVSYTGPTSIAQTNPNLASQAQNNVANSQQTQTEGGRFNLLQQMFGGNNIYTQGQQTLDNALLQGSPTQMSQLQGATQQAQQANQNYQNVNTADTNQAAGWGNFGQQQQAANVNALNTEVGNVQSNMANEYTAAQAAQAAQYNPDVAALNSGTISQTLANQLGITGPMNTYNVNAGNYVTETPLTQANTATAQDYQNIGALQALGGTAINAPNASFLSANQTNPGNLVGPNNYVAFNPTGFNSAVQGAQQAYNNAINQASYGIYGNQTLEQAINAPTGLGGLLTTDLGSQGPTNIISNPETLGSTGTGNPTFGQLGVQGMYGNTNTYNPGSYAQIQNLIYGVYGNQPGMQATYGSQPTNGAGPMGPGTGYLSGQAFQNASPEQFLNQLAESPALEQQEVGGMGPGMANSIAALNTLYGLNQQYDPTAQLTIAPASTPNLQGMMGNS